MIKDVTFLTYLPNKSSTKPGCDANGLVTIGDGCRGEIEFESHKLVSFEEPDVQSSFEFVYEPEIDPPAFNRTLCTKLHDWFDTSHVLYFQSDGFIQNSKGWTDDFLQYDYIGAPVIMPCVIKYALDNDVIISQTPGWSAERNQAWVGNGGFSLRSKKYCKVVSELWEQLPDLHRLANEDILINCLYKEYMAKRGIKIAPLDVAFKFSTEHLAPNFVSYLTSFGFHEINRFRAHPNFTRDNPMSWLPSSLHERHIVSSRRNLLSNLLNI